MKPHSQHHSISCLALVAGLALATTAAAAPVIYEPFAQTATSNLNGVTASATGLSPSTWTLNTGSSWAVSSGTLSWGAMPTTGNKIAEANPATGSQAYVTIPAASLASLPMADGQATWFSVLLTTAGDVAGSNPDFGFAIGSGLIGTSNNVPLLSGQAIGFTIKTGFLYASHWSTTTLSRAASGKAISASTTYLVVAKITWGAASDKIDIYLPDANLNLGSVQTTVTSTANLTQSGFNKLTIGRKAGSAGNTWKIDEIRFGASYQDVIGATGATAYWDQNATTAGAGGATPSGTWDAATSSDWNTDASGGSGGTVGTWPAGGVAVFAAGTDATGNYAVSVDGTPSLGGLIVEEGSPAIAGGTALDLPTYGATFEVRPGLAATINTPITQSVTGKGVLFKEGTGTMTLSGINSYACPTAVNAGTLILSGDNSGSASTATVNSGGLIQFNSTSAVYGGSGRTVTVNTGGAALFGSLSDADIATCMARIVAASAGTVAADNNAGSAFDFNTAGLTAAYLGAVGTVTYTGSLTPNGTAYRLGGGGGTLTIQNANALTGGNTLTVNGPGTVVLTANHNYTGNTAINAGGTLVAGSATSLGVGTIGQSNDFKGTLVLASTPSLNNSANTILISTGCQIRSDGGTPRTISTKITFNAGNTGIFGDAVNNGMLSLSYAGGLNPGSGNPVLQCNSDIELTTGWQNSTQGFTKSGAGTMVVSGMAGTTGLSGVTTISAGTLAGIGANAFGSTSAVSIAAAGTLSLRGDSDTTFVKKSDGTTRITLTTTASGATINADQATIAGTSPKTMTIGTFGTSSAAATYQVNFTGANSTSLSLGAVTGPASTGVATVTISNSIASPGTLTLASYTSANTTTGETVIFNNTGTTTVSGAITPSATTLSLTKNNATGTLVLGGSCAYTGATSVNAGTLLVNGSTHASSAVTVANAATLGGSGTINGTVSVTAGGIIRVGASGGTLTMANSTAPTYNNSGSTYTTMKLAASAATLDKVSANATSGNSVANVDLVIDTTGLSGNVLGAVIYQAGGAITGPFHSVSFAANPGGYSYAVDYSTSGQISLALTGGASPTISGAATAAACTTAYGVPSGEQTFTVAGSSLLADLVATAPTAGFEISPDGSTWTSTPVTFTQSGGAVSGTLHVRLAATAPVSGTYDGQVIAHLTSTGATAQDITAAASGNAVAKADASVVVTPYTVAYDGNAHTATVAPITGVNGETGATVGSVNLSTTHTAPGTYAGDSWSLTGTGNYNPIAATPITDTITGNALDSWLAAHYPGLTGANVLPTADPDHDGLVNLLEYAFDTNPTLSSTGSLTYAGGVVTAHGQPLIIQDGGTYYAVFGRRSDYLAAGLNYTVRFSTDLTPGGWSVTATTPVPVATDGVIDAVRVPFPNSSTRFFEVVVTQ